MRQRLWDKRGGGQARPRGGEGGGGNCSLVVAMPPGRPSGSQSLLVTRRFGQDLDINDRGTERPSEFEWADTHEEEGKASTDSLGFSQLHSELLEQFTVSHSATPIRRPPFGSPCPGEKTVDGKGRPYCLLGHYEPLSLFRTGHGLPNFWVEARRCRAPQEALGPCYSAVAFRHCESVSYDLLRTHIDAIETR